MNGEQDVRYLKELSAKYKEELTPLLRYLRWFEEHAGIDNSTNYDGGDHAGRTMAFPIFDSTLLAFVKEANNTSFMDSNYVYVYSRLKLKTPADERRAIEAAGITDWNVLCGILTCYVRGGMTRSYLWRQGMSESIFYLVLAKMKEIVEFWDKPLNV
ncbi:MAG: hypothetical protein IKJ39_10680 [Lachnospiraceae bacterium]|nr:hypothetical protein [Lachnospiraceae bacterium]